MTYAPAGDGDVALTYRKLDIAYKSSGDSCVFLSPIMGQWRVPESWGPWERSHIFNGKLPYREKVTPVCPTHLRT